MKIEGTKDIFKFWRRTQRRKEVGIFSGLLSVPTFYLVFMNTANFHSIFLPLLSIIPPSMLDQICGISGFPCGEDGPASTAWGTKLTVVGGEGGVPQGGAIVGEEAH